MKKFALISFGLICCVLLLSIFLVRMFSPWQWHGPLRIKWAENMSEANGPLWISARKSFEKDSLRRALTFDKSGVYLFANELRPEGHFVALPKFALSDLVEGDRERAWDQVKPGESVSLWQLPTYRFGLKPGFELLSSSQLYLNQESGELVAFLFFSQPDGREYRMHDPVVGVAYSISGDRELFRFTDSSNCEFERMSFGHTTVYRFIDRQSFAKVSISASSTKVDIAIVKFKAGEEAATTNVTKQWSDKSQFPFIGENSPLQSFSPNTVRSLDYWIESSLVDYALTSIVEDLDSEFVRLNRGDTFSTKSPSSFGYGNFTHWFGKSESEGLHLRRIKTSFGHDDLYTKVASSTSVYRFASTVHNAEFTAATLRELDQTDTIQPIQLVMRTDSRLGISKPTSENQETSDLSFVRCQNCKKLVPRVSKYCRLCKELLTTEGSIKLDSAKHKDPLVFFSAKLPPYPTVNIECEANAYVASIVSPKVSVTNDGQSTLRNCWALLIFEGVMPPVIFALGDIEKGKTASERKKIRLPRNLDSSSVKGTIQFFELRGYEAPPSQLEIELKQFPRDDFGVKWSILDDGTQKTVGNGDGKVQPGEKIHVVFELHNKSDLERKLFIRLAAEEPVIISNPSKEHLVAPNEKHRCSIEMQVPPDFSKTTVPISIDCYNEHEVLFYTDTNIQVVPRK